MSDKPETLQELRCVERRLIDRREELQKRIDHPTHYQGTFDPDSDRITLEHNEHDLAEVRAKIRELESKAGG